MQAKWQLGLSLVVLVAGCSDLDDFSVTRSTLRVGTYNGGLAYGFVPDAEARAPEVFAALPKTGLDVLCVQEFWETADWNALNAAADGVWSNSYRKPPLPQADNVPDASVDARIPDAMMDAAVTDAMMDASIMDAAIMDAKMDAAGGDPDLVRCTAEEADPLEVCARASCSDATTDMLVGCVVESCGEEVGNLGTDCFGCVSGNIGQDLDTILGRCGPEGVGGASGGFAYEGSFGTGILSSMPLRDTDALVLSSTSNRRAVLYAKLAGTAAGEVHFFCTHLTADLTSLPYTGTADSWADEQSNQIDTMLAWIDEKAGEGGTVILTGDFNSGLGMGPIIEELPENYAKYEAAGYDNLYVSQADAQCTFCDSNPTVDDRAGAEGGLIDHIFTRNLSGSDYDRSAERFLTEPLTITVDGEEKVSAYSDHYGLSMDIVRK